MALVTTGIKGTGDCIADINRSVHRNLTASFIDPLGFLFIRAEVSNFCHELSVGDSELLFELLNFLEFFKIN